ncbi:cyclin [Heterostelium album PN500]|uniref:Cyclin n=1 Tax=Heterostelium pallidum (strain ATCC 26659 / Pp 5 / PN500) TaxID=670386 RepID=D3B6M1_HETP5|nr:cyclin [Heterostelium album PN500]EFA82991.1 cyclin [Heterostelium album PN500]|eukprot:XP_020435108.1 cyclin [Heterostelium album PN500]
MAANFWDSTHWKSWILDKSKLEYSNAKDKQYITHTELKRLKIHYCKCKKRIYLYQFIYLLINFDFLVIHLLGSTLKIRQRAIATAIVYFKRFYLKNSFIDCEPRLIATTCLYLSSKVEECITQAKKCAIKMKEIDPSYNFTMNDILECEFYVLEELNFELIIYHPYKSLPAYLQNCGLDCLDSVWGIVNDSYKTDVSLLYPPYVIALGCIYLVAFIKKKDLKQWFSDLNVDMKEIWDVAKELLDYYEFDRVLITPAEAPEAIYAKLPIRVTSTTPPVPTPPARK